MLSEKRFEYHTDFYCNFLVYLFMNKSELVNAMAEKSGLTKVDCKKALEAAIAAVSEALKDGDKVSLVGFGSFSVVERAARQGVNPATGEAIEIAAKKNVKFKAGSELEL